MSLKLGLFTSSTFPRAINLCQNEVVSLFKSHLLFFLILFGNYWIWSIFLTNNLIFICLVTASIVFYLFFTKQQKKYVYIFFVLFLVLLFLQARTTTSNNLKDITNDEQRVQTQRKNLYHSRFHIIRLLFFKFPLVEFFEGDLAVATKKIQVHFFETFEPNVYFFAGHPRERIWANESYKFPFVLIIPFVIGVFGILNRRFFYFHLFFLISAIALGFTGHLNPMGPFIAFPFLVFLIYFGVNFLLLTLRKKIKK